METRARRLELCRDATELQHSDQGGRGDALQAAQQLRGLPSLHQLQHGGQGGGGEARSRRTSSYVASWASSMAGGDGQALCLEASTT